ncbi:MAG TPA: hypothetical protein ENK72_00315 [Epsilonproteobacteria bacterium]|nr:hypothetical protein [Campylobacterota bacterium]
MKSTLFAAGAALLLLTASVSADPLANVLMKEEKKEQKMVNLDNLNVGTQSRAKTAVIAMIGDKEMTKEQADQYLGLRTQGHAVDFDKLTKEQQKALVEEMALPVVAAVKAIQELSNDEKSAALSRMWMQKTVASTEVTDAEAQESYDKLVKMAKEQNKAGEVPPFEQIKREMKLQVAQEKVAQKLIDEAKIIMK